MYLINDRNALLIKVILYRLGNVDIMFINFNLHYYSYRANEGENVGGKDHS